MQQPTITQIKKADRVIVFNDNEMIGSTEYRRNTEAGYPEELCEADPATGRIWEPGMEGLTEKQMLKANDVLELWAGSRLIWKLEAPRRALITEILLDDRQVWGTEE